MLRTGIVLITTSILLGAVFCHWLVDYGVLWQKEELSTAMRAAGQYYQDLLLSPPWLYWTILGLDGLAIVTLLSKFITGDTSSYLFDGGCLVLYVATTSVYFTDVRSALVNLYLSPTSHGMPHEDIVKELASSNTVIAVALTGVLFLQGGQAWAERAEYAAVTTTPLEVAFPVPSEPELVPLPAGPEFDVDPKTPTKRTPSRRKRKA